MKPTGAQEIEAGDIVALSFNSADEEAQYIVATAKALRGIAIREDEMERGISWSDMAVLLRSVKANAEPITDAFGAAGIPYVVAGMLVSEPFPVRGYKRIAVKVVDVYGNESTVVRDLA
jgi:DNA helicase II / ATP-dependent DNA helicase PcrA